MLFLPVVTLDTGVMSVLSLRPVMMMHTLVRVFVVLVAAVSVIMMLAMSVTTVIAVVIIDVMGLAIIRLVMAVPATVTVISIHNQR